LRLQVGSSAVQQILDQDTAAWGVKVTNVEIKDIDLDETMIRAMARPARKGDPCRRREAGGDRAGRSRATTVSAAGFLATAVSADTRRYLERENSTTVFPLPLDLVTRPRSD
jgi:hypothetical protein